MELFEQKITINQLKVGMYVCRLDRPWHETDYPLQGLYIKDQVDIDHLAKYCQYVFIDEKRSRSALIPKHTQAITQNRPQPLRAVPKNTTPFFIDPKSWRQRHCVEHYSVTTTLNAELKLSAPLMYLLEEQLAYLIDKINRRRRFDIEPIAESAADLVESLIRNPDALAWLCQIKLTRKPIYLHIMRLAVWGGIVGRQMGLNRFSLVHLTMTLMMTGIGKSLIKQEILGNHNVYNHTPEYQEHLTETLYYLKQSHFSCEDIISTIQAYCERHNGSGYPKALTGGKIPFLARVAGLVDTFDLMVHPYEAKQSISPGNAIARLNKCKGTLFDPHLVETFVQAIGIYPTGSLVEINNGIIGVVVSQSYEKRIQAAIIPLINRDKKRFAKFKIFDLHLTGSDAMQNDRIIIKRGLPFHLAPPKLVAAAHEQLFEEKKGFFTKIFE